MAVVLEPSVASPAPVGTLVNWKATVSGAESGTFRYRFLIQNPGEDLRIVKDFGPENTLEWLPADREGPYVIEVTAKNRATDETATTIAWYNVLPATDGAQAVVKPTSHPLVFLYSAPPCPEGATMRVTFASADGVSQTTPAKSCDGATTMNFYIAGLKGEAVYTAKHVVLEGDAASEGSLLTFTTGKPKDGLPTLTPSGQSGSPGQGILLAGSLFSNFVASDLQGNVIWYYPKMIQFLTRPEPGGYFLAVNENPKGDESQQILRMFDLAGVTLKETNAEAVGDQLSAMGIRRIGAFHHEARRLKDGHILVLASVEQVMDGVQSDGPVDILGDTILLLDGNLQVVWAWDAFDHLDVTRKATMDDGCSPGACPPLFLATEANDWLHGNALAVTPDGNLLYSLRNQDWVIKIDFENGFGNGDVLWRLGQGGDFALNATDPQPWFSHQHEPEIEEDGTLTIFDNSIAREAADNTAHSRGQAYRLDEKNLIAEQVLNADLGDYGFVVGSAQRLDNGGYSFDVGFKLDGKSVTQEVDSNGNIVFSMSGSAPAYRTFRMRDMYTGYAAAAAPVVNADANVTPVSNRGAARR